MLCNGTQVTGPEVADTCSTTSPTAMLETGIASRSRVVLMIISISVSVLRANLAASSAVYYARRAPERLWAALDMSLRKFLISL